MDWSRSNHDIKMLLRDAWEINDPTVSPIDGGTVNDTRLVSTGTERFVLRISPVDRLLKYVDTELSMVRLLTKRGFPTPNVIPTAEGALTTTVGGRIATLFQFVEGTHPPSRDGGYGSLDLELGQSVSQLAARIHELLAPDEALNPAMRGPQPHDLLFQSAKERFTTTSVNGIDAFHDALGAASRRVSVVLDDLGADLPSGFIHADLSETNLIRDDHGQLWLIDFDDCLVSFLGYDLCSCISVFGMDESRLLDVKRASALIDAYDAVRRRSTIERAALPLLLLAWFGSQAAYVVRGIVVRGGNDVLESYSAAAFLDLCGRFDEVSLQLS